MSGNRVSKYLYLGLAVTLLSCAAIKDPTPDDYLNHARDLIQSQQYQLAKMYIDSIQILFPKEFTKIREGMTIMRQVSFAEQKRTLAFCDSMLKVRQNQLPEVSRNFVFEKDPEFETIGHYVYKTQLNEKNYGKTYLQTKVDEKGRLVLTSYYCGSKPLNHTRIRVTGKGNMFAETYDVPNDGALNYSYRDGGLTYEIVRFTQKSENGVVNFILTNQNNPINVYLNGDKTINYRLSAQDKQALKEASDLSVVLSDITRLLSEIRLAQAKLEYLNTKEKSSPTKF